MVTTPLSPLPGPQPSLSPAQQHLESPVPSAPEALAGGPTQAAPGVRVEEEEWAREIGAQLRRMADDLNAQYERRVSAGRRAGGEGDARPRQMCCSCWPSAREVAPGTSRWGCGGGNRLDAVIQCSPDQDRSPRQGPGTLLGARSRGD